MASPIVLHEVVFDHFEVEALNGADIGADEGNLGGGVGGRASEVDAVFVVKKGEVLVVNPLRLAAGVAEVVGRHG